MTKRKSILLLILVALAVYAVTFQSEAIDDWMVWLVPTWKAETLPGCQDLSTGEFIMTTTISEPFRLIRVTLAASEAITETIIVTLASATADVYNIWLDETNMTADMYYLYEPEGRALALLEEDNEVSVRCTNANSVGTVYAEIYYEQVLGRMNR